MLEDLDAYPAVGRSHKVADLRQGIQEDLVEEVGHTWAADLDTCSC